METNSNNLADENISIEVRLDGVDSPNDARVLEESLQYDDVDQFNQWIADMDAAAAAELAVINENRIENDQPKFTEIRITVTTDDGTTFEGVATS